MKNEWMEADFMDGIRGIRNHPINLVALEPV
jgi:hypothetical protein